MTLDTRFDWQYESDRGRALAYRMWCIKSATFRSVDQARRALSVSRADMRWMDRNLRGCEWCCGGGDTAYGEAGRLAEQAEAYLTSHGESVTLKPLCACCEHSPPSSGDLCSKCATHPHLSEEP